MFANAFDFSFLGFNLAARIQLKTPLIVSKNKQKEKTPLAETEIKCVRPGVCWGGQGMASTGSASAVG